MSTDAAPTEPTDPAPTGAANDDDLQAAIRLLIDAGTQLVRDLVAEPVPASMKAEPYERLARAVRRSILLARQIAEHPRQAQPAHQRARRQIIRAVEDAILRDPDAAPEADSLRGELVERLESPELEDDIANRPIADIIAEIRRDLGLDNDLVRIPWPRRSPADVQALAALAAAPLSPTRRRGKPQQDPNDNPDERFDGGPEIRPSSLLASLLRPPNPIRDD